MKSTELRIGNLFDKNGNVDTVTPNEIEALFESESREWVKPIPLTEEWLLKFGFESIKSYPRIKHFRIKLNRNYLKVSLLLADNRARFNIPGSGIYKLIDNVHSLQNLYFALTGHELTIKEVAK